MAIGGPTGAPGALRQRWFLAALLFALFSALVPAVLHSGFPASRLTGSAFDPTTSVVALRSRAQRIDRALLLQRDDAGGGAFFQPLLAFGRLAERALPLTPHPGAALPQRLAVRAERRRLTSAQPRAPPAGND